jgi:hypothetical protein
VTGLARAAESLEAPSGRIREKYAMNPGGSCGLDFGSLRAFDAFDESAP